MCATLIFIVCEVLWGAVLAIWEGELPSLSPGNPTLSDIREMGTDFKLTESDVSLTSN